MPFACGDSRSRGAQGQPGLGVPFAFSEVLPITLFKELRQRLKDEFSKTGNQATFTIQVANPDFSADFIAGLLPRGL